MFAILLMLLMSQTLCSTVYSLSKADYTIDTFSEDTRTVYVSSGLRPQVERSLQVTRGEKPKRYWHFARITKSSPLSPHWALKNKI